MSTSSSQAPEHGGLPADPHGWADQVPGDPPVPITVWRTPYQQGDTRPFPVSLAQRLAGSFSRLGDTVIDLTAGHLLAGPATCGRRHAPAVFTERGMVKVTVTRSAALFAVAWPTGQQTSDGLAAVLTSARRNVAANGSLVFLAGNPISGGYGDLVAACREAGWRYLQHIVAVRADVIGDRLVAHHLDIAGTGRDRSVIVHADLLVFTRSGGAA